MLLFHEVPGLESGGREKGRGELVSHVELEAWKCPLDGKYTAHIRGFPTG